MTSEKLVSAWEEAYREYMDPERMEVADTSVAVATAWRELAADTELPWWLYAAVNSAAEAFEHQGEVRVAAPANGAAGSPDGTVVLPVRRGGGEPSEEDGEPDQESDRASDTAVVIPALPNARSRSRARLNAMADT